MLNIKVLYGGFMSYRKNILLALGWYHPKLHEGVAQYAREHHWRLNSKMAFHHVAPKEWSGDGVLTVPFHAEGLFELLEKTDVPVVGMLRSSRGFSFPYVMEDEKLCGELAADHFLQRGFRNFAVCQTIMGNLNPRLRHFSQVLTEKNMTCHAICSPNLEDFKEQQIYFSEQIRQLPKPLAILAVDDNLAAELVQACNDSDISVPEEVAILGIHNDELICEGCEIPLSSIDINFHQIGYEAAALLDRILDGLLPEKQVKLLPPVGIVTRQSSDILAHNHPELVKALKFIRANFRNDIRVAEIVAVTAMSQKGLFKVFKRELGHPISDEIIRTRLKEAERLLLDTDDKIKTIAFESGFGSQMNLYNAFKRFHNMTPNQFRKNKIGC